MSPDHQRLRDLPAGWRSFLEELDGLLTAPVVIHCIGGFVLTALYGALRPTGDMDYIEAKGAAPNDLEGIAGEGSALARKHRVHIHHVGIVTAPEDYESRLTEVFTGAFERLQLMGLDPYDLILTKMDRNGEIDRDDARFLVTKLSLKADIFKERYRKELRPNFVGNIATLDQTYRLWLVEFFGEA